MENTINELVENFTETDVEKSVTTLPIIMVVDDE